METVIGLGIHLHLVVRARRFEVLFILRPRGIDPLVELTLEKCRAELPKRVYSKELVETIFTQPYCKIANVVKSCQVERKTASDYLKELQKIGILESEKIGNEVIYRHPNLIKLLSA